MSLEEPSLTSGLLFRFAELKRRLKWSEDFAREQLADNMFHADEDKEAVIDRIITALTEYGEVKLHERQIGFREARSIGLKIELLEDSPAMQDLILTVHHCYVHTLSNTSAYKIVENHDGAAFVKHQLQPS